jgi:hypothetical protein
MFVCFFVRLLFTDTKAFSKTKEKKEASRGRDAAQKKNESRQLQASKRKTKTEKLLKHHASNRIQSLSETNDTRKGAITVEEAKKPKLQRQLQRSRLTSANNTKSVCAKEKGEKRTGRGERRETTETLFPRIIKQKSKKKKKTATQASPKYTRDMAKDVY